MNSQLDMFPTGTGGSETQNDGSTEMFANSTTDMWASLVEKAYAQYSEQAGTVTGMNSSSNTNSYAALSGGLGEGITALTGQSYASSAELTTATSSSSAASLLAGLQADLKAGDDVIMGTDGASKGNLVGSHMYSVTSINAAAGTVTLHNPWGANAAGAGVAEDFTVTLSQLESENVGFYNAVGKAATV